MDDESRLYIDKVTPKILANLNKQTLFQYASDELKNAASPEEIDQIFNMYFNLGQFKEYKGMIRFSFITCKAFAYSVFALMLKDLDDEEKKQILPLLFKLQEKEKDI